METEQQEQPLFLDPQKQVTEEEWFEKYYQGDRIPQLTWRAVILGGLLGSMMSISNLYTSIKLGWGFGVAITACVLSYVVWTGIRTVFPKITPMTILENNCMQSTASAAGYSTGATVGVAFGALLLITGHHVSWHILMLWTLLTAALGVFLAVPMKRQMINHEQLPFPSGIAAAQTLRSLYSHSKEAVLQARALVAAMSVGSVVGFLSKGAFAWQTKLGLKLPDLIPFSAKVNGIDVGAMPAFGFEPSALLIGAGMIVGLRVSASMLLGACLLYLIFGPYALSIGEVPAPAKLLRTWSIWPGTALLVTSGLTAFALQWKQIMRAATSVKVAKKANGDPSKITQQDIEVPMKWLWIGVCPIAITMVILEYVAFSISPPLGVVSIVMSFFLALVACRATGETDVTPMGAMGKISQLTYAVLARNNMTTNLMAASVTANVAVASADLLSDLKSGYLLGANPRKQFWAQFCGIFFGTLSIVPAWYMMIPTPEVLESYNPPSVNMWRAVAEALSHGITSVPPMARVGILVGGGLGIVLALIDFFAPPKAKRFLPSAMGLGMSWVFPFANSLSFFIGALLAFVWTKVKPRQAELYTIPIASGAVAGESLVSALIAMFNAAMAIRK
jgi:OPT family oligopeptide transporter